MTKTIILKNINTQESNAKIEFYLKSWLKDMFQNYKDIKISIQEEGVESV